jgi:hypothetical protein
VVAIPGDCLAALPANRRHVIAITGDRDASLTAGCGVASRVSVPTSTLGTARTVGCRRGFDILPGFRFLLTFSCHGLFPFSSILTMRAAHDHAATGSHAPSVNMLDAD